MGCNPWHCGSTEQHFPNPHCVSRWVGYEAGWCCCNSPGRTMFQRERFDVFWAQFRSLILHLRLRQNHKSITLHSIPFKNELNRVDFKVCGRFFCDFLTAIDSIHLQMMKTYPNMENPFMYVADEDVNGVLLHYRTSRQGYCPYLKGIFFKKFVIYWIKSFVTIKVFSFKLHMIFTTFNFPWRSCRRSKRSTVLQRMAISTVSDSISIIKTTWLISKLRARVAST